MRNYLRKLIVFFACAALAGCSNSSAGMPNPETHQAPGTQKAPETAPPAKPASFRFVVMGDSRGAGDAIAENTLRKLLSRVKELKPQPAFVIFTGDQVQGKSVDAELGAWKRIVSDYYPLNVVFPTLGNHD